MFKRQLAANHIIVATRHELIDQAIQAVDLEGCTFTGAHDASHYPDFNREATQITYAHWHAYGKFACARSVLPYRDPASYEWRLELSHYQMRSGRGHGDTATSFL